MKKIIYICTSLIFMFCLEQTVFAGPITIFNGTAERVPEGKWIIEAHYGYYQTTVIKNTAYWGYASGDGHMDNIDNYDMRYINHVFTSEVYYAFTDRVLIGGVFPYVIRDVKKQPYVGGKVSSNGPSDIALIGYI